MSTTLDLPLTIRDLPAEVLRWLLIKSAESGKSTDEVARELLATAAKRAGFKPEPEEKSA